MHSIRISYALSLKALRKAVKSDLWLLRTEIIFAQDCVTYIDFSKMTEVLLTLYGVAYCCLISKFHIGLGPIACTKVCK